VPSTLLAMASCTPRFDSHPSAHWARTLLDEIVTAVLGGFSNGAAQARDEGYVIIVRAILSACDRTIGAKKSRHSPFVFATRACAGLTSQVPKTGSPDEHLDAFH